MLAEGTNMQYLNELYSSKHGLGQNNDQFIAILTASKFTFAQIQCNQSRIELNVVSHTH